LKLEEIFNKTLTKFKSDPENSEILNDKDMKAYNDLVDILIAESFIKVTKSSINYLNFKLFIYFILNNSFQR